MRKTPRDGRTRACPGMMILAPIINPGIRWRFHRTNKSGISIVGILLLVEA